MLVHVVHSDTWLGPFAGRSILKLDLTRAIGVAETTFDDNWKALQHAKEIPVVWEAGEVGGVLKKYVQLEINGNPGRKCLGRRGWGERMTARVVG
jgi:hypothetical protein